MFIDRVLGASDAWAAWVIAVTWQLAALAVVAWVIQRVLRLRQPGARYGLWWFVLSAPLVLGPARMALEHRQAVVRVPAPAVVEQAVTRVHVPVVVPVERVVPHAAAPVAEVAWWSGVRAVDVLGMVWALGCLLLAARLVVGHARARRLVGESRAVDDGEALGALAELCAEAAVRREVGLRVSSLVGAPVLYGVRRPTILLPEDWVETRQETRRQGAQGSCPTEMSRVDGGQETRSCPTVGVMSGDDLRALLAHEVAHVRRGDCLANLLQRIVEIPAFFHPGVWLASRGITLAREELADGWALARGVEASSYARSLAAAAERTQGRLGAVSVGVAEGKSTLLRRVEAIMRGGSLKRMSRPLVVALIGAALVSAGAFAAVEVRGEAKPAIMPAIPQGVHLTYFVTSQLPAWPPECIEQHIAAVRGQQAGPMAELTVRMLQRRAAAGPEETDTAYYWGTERGFMYARANGGCVAYDGRKSASGSSLCMVPDLIEQPTTEHSGIVIAWGTSTIQDLVPYLGVYQPGMELFDNAGALSETVPLRTGEKRVYPLPYRRKAILEYDEEGRVRTLTITTDDESILMDEYRFTDYAVVDGVSYPREVKRKKVMFFRGGDGKIALVPDWLVTWRVVDANAGPIPGSFFALSTARPGAQVQDDRYQVPGRTEPGIIYTYSDPNLSIDEASERAYQEALLEPPPDRSGCAPATR